MKYLKQTLAIVLATFLLGCSSSKTMDYAAKWKQTALFSLAGETDQADSRSRAAFGIQNNDNTLFVNLKTREANLIRSIISNGVQLTFTPEGSKKKAGELLFPVVLKQDRRAIRKMEHVDLFGPTMQFLLETFNKEAIWNEGNGQRFVDLIQPKEGIQAAISMSTDGELMLQYEIALEKLRVHYPETKYLDVILSVDESSKSGIGITPGISVGMGTGGFGMGGIGVGVGNRGAYSGNNGYELKMRVALASSPQ